MTAERIGADDLLYLRRKAVEAGTQIDRKRSLIPTLRRTAAMA